ncbi:MAG: hypothetical protein WAW26_23075, partial [Anaerolineae bacterium]
FQRNVTHPPSSARRFDRVFEKRFAFVRASLTAEQRTGSCNTHWLRHHLPWALAPQFLQASA